MAKKADKGSKKNIETKTTPEPTVEPKVGKKTTKQSKVQATSNQFQLFPSHLETRFTDFGNLYNEINASIAESGKGDSFDVTLRRTDLAEKIQSACTEVFRSELRAAILDIEDTQAGIESQIQNLEGSYDKVRAILEETKAFRAEQITTTLALLEEKVNDKKASLAKYQQLLDKANNVYV